jgi:hypothetical protein
MFSSSMRVAPTGGFFEFVTSRADDIRNVSSGRLACQENRRKWRIALNEHVSRDASLAAALTTLHLSPTMKSVPYMLQRIARFVAAVADHGSLVTNNRQPLNMGYLNV